MCVRAYYGNNRSALGGLELGQNRGVFYIRRITHFSLLRERLRSSTNEARKGSKRILVFGFGCWLLAGSGYLLL